MAKYPNDDLFENTKMSFGQHLEELRVSLFKAVLGLLIGFVIGLLISSNVMAWMQSPLTRALENYYIDKAIDDLQVETGAPITPELKQFIVENRLVFDDILIDASEIRRIAGIVG
ncbi:MAG TPA: twin-arginine translocase subunit TatC, partial [Pirellulaceae bacterium]|nr:twin-arginine translocase subunit TatC [Pirellulaceae bacterium]